MCRFILVGLFIVFFANPMVYCQQSGEVFADSIPKRERRKEQKEIFKKNNRRFFFTVSSVQAKLNTTASFDVFDGLLSANVGLEKNLGLPDKKSFFTASLMHRFTPSSGLYVNYYGIDRVESYRTQEDIVFLGDTIPAGSEARGYFDTKVLSAGYLLSLLKDPNAFLGAYLNVYLMSLGTGVSSDFGDIDAQVSFTAPLPNLGLVAMFRLKEWLYINGNIGFFSLYLEDFNGSLYDFSARLIFKPLKWLGLNVSYQEFDIRVQFPNEDIQTTIDYNFRGPAFGLSLMF